MLDQKGSPLVRVRFHGQAAREKILNGVNAVANAVKTTMGAKGRTVFTSYGHATKDGVTVARDVELFEDTASAHGARLIKEAAINTCDKAGDGPQPLWSKVLTPTGFVAMKEIKQGMEICGTNGTKQKVIGVFDKGVKQIYKVELIDGRVVLCSEEHLWQVSSELWKGKSKLMTTKQLFDRGPVKTNKTGEIRHLFYIQNNEVDFQENKDEMPLDPYFLGVLLGDGSLSGTGSIELSLGFKKRHILKKLKLPEGVTASSRDCKKYIRVKLKDSLLKKSLERLGLYGTKSDSKFIPSAYLYSSQKSRKELLRGLIDTDGHINTRGLFEFSTVSPKLARDFTELCNGLGITVHSRIHSRNQEDSYSDRPIFRITELKGYKLGIPIHSIEQTTEKTQMRCIKVSNPDHLYITDGYVVTHNTTTVCVIAQTLIKEGLRLINDGKDPQDLKKELEQSKDKIISALKDQSMPATDVSKIANISANDPKLGEIVAKAVTAVGVDGLVTIEKTYGEQEIEVADGMQLDKGLLRGPYLTDGERRRADYKDVAVLLFNGKIHDLIGFAKAVEPLVKEGKPILIVADDYDTPVARSLELTMLKGMGRFIPIKSPHIYHDETFQDLAAYTGATVLTEADSFKNFDPSFLGHAKQVIATVDKTTIRCDDDRKEAIAKQIEVINEHAKQYVESERKNVLKRASRLKGKTAIVKLPETTEAEGKEVRDRVEDAIYASQAALEMGIVPGGGYAYLAASYELEGKSDGDKVLRLALSSPLKQIVKNAGHNDAKILELCEKQKMMFNVLTEEFEDTMATNVIDPLKVALSAFENALSVALVALTTEVVIAEQELKEE